MRIEKSLSTRDESGRWARLQRPYKTDFSTRGFRGGTPPPTAIRRSRSRTTRVLGRGAEEPLGNEKGDRGRRPEPVRGSPGNQRPRAPHGGGCAIRNLTRSDSATTTSPARLCTEGPAVLVQPEALEAAMEERPQPPSARDGDRPLAAEPRDPGARGGVRETAAVGPVGRATPGVPRPDSPPKPKRGLEVAPLAWASVHCGEGRSRLSLHPTQRWGVRGPVRPHLDDSFSGAGASGQSGTVRGAR